MYHVIYGATASYAMRSAPLPDRTMNRLYFKLLLIQWYVFGYKPCLNLGREGVLMESLK